MIAISVKSLCKDFKIWQTIPDRELKTKLVKWMRFDFSGTTYSTRRVLHEVSFDIQKGQFAAIMGKNGMGKSTILKLICGIYKPTLGSVEIHGRLAPLLELGAGFDPQLTGYENIFLYASILGYDNETIKAACQEIIDFAGIGDSVYLPLKNYSSGMLVRLGFSIVVNLDFDILLLDEVLGVGDAQFYNKSVQRIIDLHKKGKTILLVTHNFDQASQFCERCILINDGRVDIDGPPDKVRPIYNKIMGF